MDENKILKSEDIKDRTQQWIEKAVIGLNLCPFAKAVYVQEKIRYVVSEARDADTLLADLKNELRSLKALDASVVDTTLIIHPYVFTEFLAYNEFLDIADLAIEELDLTGEIQVASFHPEYQFAGTKSDDIENYTNRSPYPILHLLRESSVEAAIASVPDADDIYKKNIETLRRLGHDGWNKLKI